MHNFLPQEEDFMSTLILPTVNINHTRPKFFICHIHTCHRLAWEGTSQVLSLEHSQFRCTAFLGIGNVQLFERFCLINNDRKNLTAAFSTEELSQSLWLYSYPHSDPRGCYLTLPLVMLINPTLWRQHPNSAAWFLHTTKEELHLLNSSQPWAVFSHAPTPHGIIFLWPRFATILTKVSKVWLSNILVWTWASHPSTSFHIRLFFSSLFCKK